MFSRIRTFTLGFIAIGLISLFGCGGADGPESAGNGSTAQVDPTNSAVADPSDSTEVTNIEDEGEAAEAAEPTIAPSPTSPPIPTPTPVPAEIVSAGEEPLFVEDSLNFEQIAIPEDGWLVVWPDTGGTLSADSALGFVDVKAGVQAGLTVMLDAADIRGKSVQVALHGGRTADGEFGASTDNLLLIQTLAVETAANRPTVEITNNIVTDDGFLQIDSVQSDGPGWITVWNESGDEMLGFTSVEAGKTADVSVPIQWHTATTNVQVRLLQDLGSVGDFEADVDVQAEFQGEPIGLELAVGLPVEIVAFDQPMPDSVTISRITSPKDGFIVVFGDPDANGFPDTILGYEPISAGVSEYVEIDIDETAVTTQTIMSLYADSNSSGEFDFPDDDPILSGGGEPFQEFFPVRSDIDAFLVVDSSPTAESIMINWVATPLDSWLVIEKIPVNLENGDRQSPSGQLRLAPGLVYNQAIPLEGLVSGDRVTVTLYINNIDENLFEPQRNDFPLLANERLVFVEVTIQE